jgi:hypothetical protein
VSGSTEIEILYFDGCPNLASAVELVERSIRSTGTDPVVELVEIADEEAARGHGFPGSPTIRVDGTDVEPGAEARDPAFACRVYATSTGLAGVPDEAWVRDALARSAGA